MAFTQKWFTADFHFGHPAALGWGLPSRSFASVEEMDAAIIAAANERVAATDLLYVLGDFAVCHDAEYVSHCFHALRGRKVLVIGNHDVDKKGRLKPSLASLPWDCPPVAAMETHAEGERVWLSHYAHRVWPASHHGAYHLYGHSHGKLPASGRSRDVGIDCDDIGFRPASFSQLKRGLE